MACSTTLRPSLGELHQRIGRRCFAISDFDLHDTVGLGGFGRVRMVKLTDDPSHHPFALKIQEKSEILAKGELRHVLAEKAILQELQHPFIVNMFSCFQDEQHIFMLLEFINGGKLFSHIRAKGYLPEDDAKFYSAEIALALEYLHNRLVIYRDLNPENVLLDCQGHVKLIDFGIAGKAANSSRKGITGRRMSFVGTSEYLSPELIQLKTDEASGKDYDSSVDWWAFGVLVYEMLVGQPPFYGEDEFALYQKIVQVDVIFPKRLSASAISLIKIMLPAREIRWCCGLLKKKATQAPELTADSVKCLDWFYGMDWGAAISRCLKPPFVPCVASPDDTSMFESYPEPTCSATAVSEQQQAEFKDFGHFARCPVLLGSKRDADHNIKSQSVV